jgi:hypothetical protein
VTSESATAFFASGQDVISTLANITASMTNKIPLSGSGLSAQGIVWQQQSIITIQFAWLALPLVLILLSAILLVSTVLMARSSAVPVWKSSPLPFLYHGIREWDDKEEQDLLQGRLEKVHTMEDRARIK